MYKRILLKLSGEALSTPSQKEPIDVLKLNELAQEIKEVYDLKTEICIVVGAGNIYRGKLGAKMGMERTAGDYMGMIATILNALAIQNSLETIGVPTRVMTSLNIPECAEPYIRRKALSHLEKGKVVIFGGGTGNPYFSTDTTAALRALEVGAEIILFAKNGTNGVYSSDPNKNSDAKHYSKISYMDIINKKLEVMDSTAVSLCMDNHMKMYVFNMNEKGNILKAAKGDTSNGTLIE